MRHQEENEVGLTLNGTQLLVYVDINQLGDNTKYCDIMADNITPLSR
jgi:hypothetical protein